MLERETIDSRIAEAIAEADLGDPNDPPFYFEALTEEYADKYYKMARAAIKAMKTASGEFGEFCYGRQSDGVASWAIEEWSGSSFEAFIDAALKEHEGAKV